MLLSPRLFIVGGGVSKKADKFFPLIDIRTPIVPATLLNNAGIIGAAVTAEQAGGRTRARSRSTPPPPAHRAEEGRWPAPSPPTPGSSREELLEFLRPRHHAILMTTRRDGRPQSSPNTCGVDTEGRIVISTYPERAKVGQHPPRPAGVGLRALRRLRRRRGCRSTASPR